MLRLDLLAYVKEHGEDALKWLCRKMADTKTASTVLKLNVPIYGEPDAGKHFETKHSSVLTGPCGLRRCKTQPCFYVQYYYRKSDQGRECIGYLFNITLAYQRRPRRTPCASFSHSWRTLEPGVSSVSLHRIAYEKTRSY